MGRPPLPSANQTAVEPYFAGLHSPNKFGVRRYQAL